MSTPSPCRPLPLPERLVPVALALAPLALLALVALGQAAVSGCGDDAVVAPAAGDSYPDLLGEYDDGFAAHAVRADRWRIGGDAFLYAFVDNEAGILVARNTLSNAFSPGLWSRFAWTTHDSRVWYCQVAFDAPTRDEAMAAANPDASDPASGGCSGFSWSTLVPVAPELAGSWHDGFAEHTIGGETWTMSADGSQSTFHLVQVSNALDFAVAHNDEQNPFSPGLWSRFDWARAGSDLYYCQTMFAASSRAEAAAAEPPDASTPSAGGCGGFPWSPLTSRSTE
jgi:hypothetical protein